MASYPGGTLCPPSRDPSNSSHLEHSLAGLLFAGQVGQDGADGVREHEVGIHEPLKQQRQNINVGNQNLEGQTEKLPLVGTINARNPRCLPLSARALLRATRDAAHPVQGRVGRQVDEGVVAVRGDGDGAVGGQGKQGSE